MTKQEQMVVDTWTDIADKLPELFLSRTEYVSPQSGAAYQTNVTLLVIASAINRLADVIERVQEKAVERT